MKNKTDCSPRTAKQNKKKNYYHPFELSFVGYSGAGKTTLIEKLVQGLSADYQIGFVKHDAHGFQMDREGKDTFRLTQAGAAGVSIHCGSESAFLDHRNPDEYRRSLLFQEFDFVLIEGLKDSSLPKVLVLDSENKILQLYQQSELENVQILVGTEDPHIEGLLFFHRDDIVGLSLWVKEFFNQKVAAQPLCGLVLTGGRSTRMGRDKAMISYHGEPQVTYMYKLLQKFCSQTFVSVRMPREDVDLPQLPDSFMDMGPVGGLLTAMKSQPEAAWLVVACDLPLIDENTIRHLIEKRNPFRNATVYQSSEDGFPEPLCAIYEPKAQKALLWFLGLGYQCPRKVLINSRVELIALPEADCLKNSNTPEEYESIVKEIQKANQ